MMVFGQLWISFSNKNLNAQLNITIASDLPFYYCKHTHTHARTSHLKFETSAAGSRLYEIIFPDR